MAPAKILLFGVCWLTAFTLSGCGKQGTTPEPPLSAGRPEPLARPVPSYEISLIRPQSHPGPSREMPP